MAQAWVKVEKNIMHFPGHGEGGRNWKLEKIVKTISFHV